MFCELKLKSLFDTIYRIGSLCIKGVSVETPTLIIAAPKGLLLVYINCL
jgi:hypothetical protein